MNITDYAEEVGQDKQFKTIIVLEPPIIRNHFQEIDTGRCISNVINQNTNFVIFEYCSKLKYERQFKKKSTNKIESLDSILKEREIENCGQLFIKFITNDEFRDMKLIQAGQIINFIRKIVADHPIKGTKNIIQDTLQFCESII